MIDSRYAKWSSDSFRFSDFFGACLTQTIDATSIISFHDYRVRWILSLNSACLIQTWTFNIELLFWCFSWIFSLNSTCLIQRLSQQSQKLVCCFSLRWLDLAASELEVFPLMSQFVLVWLDFWLNLLSFNF